MVENRVGKMKAKAITGMEARSKSISSIVGEVDRFLLGMEFTNCKNGPKNRRKCQFWGDENETLVRYLFFHLARETTQRFRCLVDTYILDLLSSCQGECQ